MRAHLWSIVLACGGSGGRLGGCAPGSCTAGHLSNCFMIFRFRIHAVALHC